MLKTQMKVWDSEAFYDPKAMMKGLFEYQVNKRGLEGASDTNGTTEENCWFGHLIECKNSLPPEKKKIEIQRDIGGKSEE